jgi:Gram-negative bacterial TonB protein C-terminal
LRLASLMVAGTLGATPHTIGIFDANAFERRIMNLTGKHKEIPGMRRVATLAVCAALGLATCASAVALGMHVNTSPAAGDSNASKPPRQVSVPAAVMQGNLLNRVIPVYPAEAKKAKIQGTVVLSAVISKNGNVATCASFPGRTSFSNHRSMLCGSGPTSPIFSMGIRLR